MSIDLIKSRRSIRKYKNESIKDEDIKTIIEAGMYAPSAHNRQPWHFIVVKDRDVLNTLKNNHPHMGMLETADCVIVVCGDIDSRSDFWASDCAAATQNILLGAKALGYGTCWCGVYPRENLVEIFSRVFKLPNNIKPFSAISLGVPDEEKQMPERYKPDRVHIDTW